MRGSPQCPIPSKETGDRKARPTRLLLGSWGYKNVKTQQDLASIRDDVTSLLRAERDDGAVALGGRGDAVFEAVLATAERVVKPDGRSKNRIAAGENAATG